MNQSLTLGRIAKLEGTIHHLPASKSISNRVLLIQALAGGKSVLHNVSEANDTVVMTRLLNSADEILDAEDAGTVMRFLSAYTAVTAQSPIIVTGSHRMKERPIGILVDALRHVGAHIEYVEKEGYPPIRVIKTFRQVADQVSVRGDVSSQYISALMMIAPVLPSGLTLNLLGKVGSMPYIQMTAALMKKFGVSVSVDRNTVTILPQSYQPVEYTVEADWSGASYWFAFTALAKQASLTLPSVTLRSLQGDRVIVDMMEPLGVMAEPQGNNLLLKKKDHVVNFSWNFTDCPDLAQTVAVVCAAKGVRAEFTGLESLRIKETDRIAALQRELQKIGAQLTEENNRWILNPGENLPASVSINTYQDHRMAMAFAPLSCLMDVTFDDASVVKKSYPKFWDDVLSVRAIR
jgi:3-phosphoshikimate 1-carboxyvinyltransferase